MSSPLPVKDSRPFTSRQVKKTLFSFDSWLDSLEDDDDQMDCERGKPSIVEASRQRGLSDVDSRLKELKTLLTETDDLLTHVDFALGLLNTSKTMYDQALRKTKDVQEVADRLLQEQHSLVVCRERMEESLSYFDSLPSLTRNLSNLTPSSMNESLVPLLSRLDECIAFLESKPTYRESADYLSKFRSLQHSSLLAIKTHVVNQFKVITHDLMPPDQQLKEGDSVFSLFYAKFQQACHPLKLLVSLIEERTSFNSIFLEFLNECHESFVECRGYLMGPVLTVALEDMKASHASSVGRRNDCALVKNSSRMVMHVVRDEFNLFNQVFSTPSPRLTEFLDEFCKKLYDTLRPIVITLNPIETLAELCLLIREDILVFEGEQGTITDPESLSSFESVMEQLLGDIQLRLVHRTEMFVKEDILGYKPCGGDLAYPDKLIIMEGITDHQPEKTDPSSPTDPSHRVLKRSDSALSIASNALSDISFVSSDRRNWDQKMMVSKTSSPSDFHGMWYPTLRRTLLSLSKLYRCLDRPTFQNMSQDIVEACLISLEEASHEIAAKKGKIDGSLFLLTHLLILREQITPFHIEVTIREVNLDFDRVRNAALDLAHHPARLFSLSSNNSLLQFFMEDETVPIQVKEQVFDPKKILDKKIRLVCSQFISSATEFIASSVIRFCHLIKSLERSQRNQVGQQQPQPPQSPQIGPQLTADFVKTEASNMKEQLKTQVPLLKKSMKIYLGNPDTEGILYRPIKTGVLGLFGNVRTFVTTSFSHPDLMVINVPSTDEVQQLLL